MIQERDVKAKVLALLRDEISVMDFVRWIMANSWNMHSDSSDAAIDLVSDIHLLIAERDDRSLNDEAFRGELGSLLNVPPVIHKLNKAGLLNKSGDKFSLKQL